jgi:hypothetical protein
MLWRSSEEGGEEQKSKGDVDVFVIEGTKNASRALVM